MLKCNVGKDFKIGFLKRNLNFCYDQENGLIYAADIVTLEKLGIENLLDKNSEIEEVKNNKLSLIDELIEIDEVCFPKEKIQDNTHTEEHEKIEDTFSDVYKTIEIKENKSNKQFGFVNKKQKKTEEILGQILEFQKEQEVLENNSHETIETLKNSICILNKKIKDSNEKIQNLSIKFDAVLEILSENILKAKNNQEQFIDITKNGITVDRILKSTKDKTAAGILSITFMLKKALEEKGVRLN